MSSIPLPALDIKTDQGPGPLQQFMTLQQILGQQTQNQTGQIQNQQAQQSQKDQAATTAALKQWDGKNPNDLPHLILQNGGSSNAVLNAQSKLIDMRQKAATLDETTLKNQQTTNDQYRGRVLSIVNAPADQKQSLWAAEVAKERQAGAQLSPDITDQYPGDDVATQYANHFALGSTLAKEAIDAKQANARQTSANASAGELTLKQNEFNAKTDPNSPLYDPSAAYLAKKAASGDSEAQAIVAQQTKQAATKAGAVAGAEAQAKFPWEARLEQMKQQGDPVFAYDPKSQQTIQVSRAEAQQAGYTNIVKVGQSEIDKAKTSAMQLGDATMNIQAYKQASQRMDELSGSDIATVSRVLGDTGFKAHFLGAELPTDWLNELYRSKGWQDMPETAKDAVVNYLAARPAAISLLRAINPGVRLTESQIATELRNIPDPTTPSDIRDKQFARLDRNIDQASKTLVKIPGVDMPNEIRDRLETQQGAADAVKAKQNAAATGQYRNARGYAMKEGQDAYANGKYIGTVSKVYGDGSYDVEPD
jgi:hypothetical protein